MILADIPHGASVFVDANTFVYHLAPDPVFGPSCKLFFERIGQQQIQAFTSTHELSDVAHRLMTMEATTRFGWPVAGIAQRLRQHPSDLKKLGQFRAAVEDVEKSKVQFLPVTAAMVVSAASISQQFGLLSGDALIVAVLKQNGLDSIASNDADFDSVPGLTRYEAR